MSNSVASRCSSRLKAQKTSRKRGREDKEKEDEGGKNSGLAAEISTTTTTVWTTTTTSTTSKTSSKGEEEATCCVCIVNEPSAKIRPCGHTVTCRGCTEKLMKQGDPCPFCRKPIEGFVLGKWSSSTGAAGLWPTSLKNLSELASGEGFNDYFRDSFKGNEATWKKWKEVFDVLGIGAKKGGGSLIETQILRITNSEDLVKLRALAKLCSQDFFNDKTLLLVVWRRILEVLNVKGKGVEKNLDIIDACAELGNACNNVRDFEDARRYFKLAQSGYEFHLSPNNSKALDVTRRLILCTEMHVSERIEKLGELVERCEGALGGENELMLMTLNNLGVELQDNEDFEEAKEVYERCLEGRTKVLGFYNKDTLQTLNSLGLNYILIGNHEKGLQHYERALEGKEKTLGKTHPETLVTVMNIAICYETNYKDYEKAQERYERALKGFEAQFGSDHEYAKRCAENFMTCLRDSGVDEKRLAELKEDYPM